MTESGHAQYPVLCVGSGNHCSKSASSDHIPHKCRRNVRSIAALTTYSYKPLTPLHGRVTRSSVDIIRKRINDFFAVMLKQFFFELHDNRSWLEPISICLRTPFGSTCKMVIRESPVLYFFIYTFDTATENVNKYCKSVKQLRECEMITLQLS